MSESIIPIIFLVICISIYQYHGVSKRRIFDHFSGIIITLAACLTLIQWFWR